MQKKLFVVCIFISALSFGQIDLSYNIDATIDTNNFTISGKWEVSVTNIGNKDINKIPVEIWTNAYKNKGTFLAEERLEDQKTDLYFADSLELGFTQISNLRYYNDPKKKINVTLNEINELYVLKLNKALGKNERITIEAQFLTKLPSAYFNGFGFDLQTIRLSNWFPKISGYTDSSFYPVYNSRLRCQYQNKANITARITLKKDIKLAASTNYRTKLTDENQTLYFNASNVGDITLLLYPQHYTFAVPKHHTPNTQVIIHYVNDLPPLDFTLGFKKIAKFIQRELGVLPPDSIHLAFLDNKKSFESSGHLLVMEFSKRKDELEGAIVEEWIKTIFSEQLGINSAQYPWMVNGIAHYYKTLYYTTYYPEKKYLGWIAKTKLGKFFDADEYPYEYRNTFLFNYMARQGLDQPISDSAAAFPKLNYQAIVQGKTSLWLDYARLYVGENNFRRGIKKFVSDFTNQSPTPQDLKNALQYYHNEDLDWILGDIHHTTKKYNYKLAKTEDCSYLYTATIKNKGKLATPYSITGYKDDKVILTEWFPGHEGKQTMRIHLEEYDVIQLNTPGKLPEYYQKNNRVKTKGLFKKSKPLRLQFYTSFENPNKAQLFWLPNLKYNAYDKFLIGAQFYNTTLVSKPFEYRLSPDYSTGTGKLVGSGSLKYNWIPQKGMFHQVSAALYGRYYHYADGLAYSRFSPTVNFNIRKSSPRSNIIQKLRLRSVIMDREVPSGIENPQESLNYASYQVLDLRYSREDVHVLRPHFLNIDIQYANQFSKIQLDFTQRYRLGKNHTIAFRAFAGTFLFNNNPNSTNYYSFGLSGTQDYLFDYYFLGRSDESGIWSQQFFTTDGGFKSETNTFSNTSMFSFGSNIPLWRYLKVFGDVAYLPGNKNSPNFYWDYGLALVIIPDFVEVYFPIQSNLTNFYNLDQYHLNIRYVLNLDFTQIVHRLRRGYY